MFFLNSLSLLKLSLSKNFLFSLKRKRPCQNTKQLQIHAPLPHAASRPTHVNRIKFKLIKNFLKHHLHSYSNHTFEDARAGLTIRARGGDCVLNRMGLIFWLLFYQEKSNDRK
jgi:hypothetical protein